MKILKDFFIIFGMWAGPLEHIINEGSSVWNLVIIGLVTLEEMLKIVKIWESRFKGSKNNLHVLYSQIFINSFSQLYIPIFRPNL